MTTRTNIKLAPKVSKLVIATTTRTNTSYKQMVVFVTRSSNVELVKSKKIVVAMTTNENNLVRQEMIAIVSNVT